jgi:hypothetical protein
LAKKNEGEFYEALSGDFITERNWSLRKKKGRMTRSTMIMEEINFGPSESTKWKGTKK